MFVKRKHIEALKDVAEGRKREELDKATEMELFILNFVKDDALTEQGKAFYEIVKGLNVKELPEVFLDTQILTMLRIAALSSIPEEWKEELRARGLYDGEVTERGLKLLAFVREHRANLFITPEMLELLVRLGVVGSLGTLRALAEEVVPGGGQNVINALQAQKLLTLGPKGDEVAYATTTSARLLPKLIPSIEKPMVLTAEELEAMYGNVFSGDLAKYEEEGAISDEGIRFLQFYEALEAEPYFRAPGYLTKEELEVLETIRKIEEIHSNTPSILPTVKEIEERGRISHVRRKLYLLQFKGLVEFKEVEMKETYWLTKDGRKALSYGPIALRASRALAYALSNEAPAFGWYREAVEEELVRDGQIKPKGHFALKIGDNQREGLYLTKWDTILMLALPKARFVQPSEVEVPEDFEGSFFAEAEAKGFVRVLQNGAMGLTSYGKKVREALEKANVAELKAVEFPITPNTYTVLSYFYHNREELSKIWRAKGFNKLIIEVAKALPLSIVEIKKALVVLRGIGLLGDKGIREAGKLLVEAFERMKRAGVEA